MRTSDHGDGQPDPRKRELDNWVSALLGERVSGEPASADASFRRYFRYHCRRNPSECGFGNGSGSMQPQAPSESRPAPGQGPYSVVAMDAPPEQEDCRPFIAVAALLRRAPVNVPMVLAQDLRRGFLLLTDLGKTTYLQRLSELPPGPVVQSLYQDATDALIRLQALPYPADFPCYDAPLLRRELELFPEWYVQRHLQRVWGEDLQRRWESLCTLLLERALAQPRVLVHRDYMPRNLMVCADNPGILDFQDAVAGPVSYDPVCLFEDAFLSWPRDFVESGLHRYWSAARTAGLPVPQREDFMIDCDLMAVQRHLKVIGIFARIFHRDGKPHYLADTPRFFAYLRGAAARQPQRLAPLAELLDLLGEPA